MDRNKEMIGALITTALLITIGLLSPLTLSLGTGEIDGVSDQISFYSWFYWSLVVIWAIYLVFRYTGINNKYGDGTAFSSIGQKPGLEMFKGFTHLQLSMLSLIIFSITFLLANINQLGGFTGLRVLPQQFSPAQSLLFSTFLIPIPENLLATAVIGLLLLILTFISIKFKLRESDYFIFSYIGTFFVLGTFGVIWHKTAYPDSDIVAVVIFMFWGIIGLIGLATQSIWPGIIMHQMNNFFIDFSRLYTSDTLVATVITMIFGTLVLYLFMYRGRLLGGKQNKGVTL